jgi:hypothetical protein
MSAMKIKTSYSEIEHIESFWDAVFDFIALKEAEGEQIASALMTDCVATGLMTDCVATGATLSNLGHEGECMSRTSALQQKAVHSLWAFLDDPALTPEGRDVALEAVWETAKV